MNRLKYKLSPPSVVVVVLCVFTQSANIKTQYGQSFIASISAPRPPPPHPMHAKHSLDNLSTESHRAEASQHHPRAHHPHHHHQLQFNLTFIQIYLHQEYNIFSNSP